MFRHYAAVSQKRRKRCSIPLITIPQRYRRTDKETDGRLVMAIPHYALHRAVIIIMSTDKAHNVRRAESVAPAVARPI